MGKSCLSVSKFRITGVGGRREMQTWFLVEKPEGKRPFTRHGRRWECDIKIDLKVMGWEGVYRIDLVQYTDKLGSRANAVMRLRVL
jgi:hypothetical protein